MGLETHYVWASDGMKLWTNTRECPHENQNACAFCDFDHYYANKHQHMCPWFGT